MTVSLVQGMHTRLTDAEITLAEEEADRTLRVSSSVQCYVDTSATDRRTTRLHSAGGELALARWLHGEWLPTSTAAHPDVRMQDGRTVDAKLRSRRFAAVLLNTESYARCDLYMKLYMPAFPDYEWRGYATHDELIRQANIQPMPAAGRAWAWVRYQEQLHDRFDFEVTQ